MYPKQIMNTPRLFVAALLLAFTSGLFAATESFDKLPVGKLPAPWQTGVTGTGDADWQIVAVADAPSGPHALRQSGVGSYLWCAQPATPLRDGFVEVKAKAVSGKKDQSIGIVWRFTDANNYYLARSNSLEGNVVIYKFQDGKRTMLPVKGQPPTAKGVDIPVPAGAWHTMRVEFEGALFTVFFNGRQLFQVEDTSFVNAGGVGLWTKADSVTLFDDFASGAK